MSIDWEINEKECTYQKRSASGEITSVYDRPSAPHINKLMKKGISTMLLICFVSSFLLIDFFQT